MCSASSIPGAFPTDDERWWDAAPLGFFESPDPPNDSSSDFQKYDATLWENASTVVDHVPGCSGSSQDENIIVAVMGVTGSGKSTFVKLVSGRDDVIVGDSLQSETSEVRAYEFFHKDTSFILVDTPGFDDTKSNDNQITQMILDWLRSSLLEGTQLNGVIYLHRISDPRMGGTALRNNRMFRKLCGENAFKNVILATTFWEGVPAHIGAQREKELCENRDFWGGMLEKGARIARLQNNRQSGLELLEKISANAKFTLGAQDEMVKEGKTASETEALRAEVEELERVQRELEARKEAARLQMEIEQERARVELEMKLRKERERLRQQREAERVAEERREARAKREAQILYEKQLEEIRLERVRQEEKMRAQKAEIERKERLERQMQEIRERAAALEIARRRKEYQDNYVCIGVQPQWVCDKCKGKVKRYAKYYRKSVIRVLKGGAYTDIRHRLLLLRFGQILSLRGLWQ
ncbi:P-loop containing nucleoside triphosphate hydrolase protein [Acephala macrosclerotiorum]|nr:P-loop containing nucleoside triphosphate hydrolase protein [Acephala macrosclerotiorum]